jgi:FkbM family methyltransferase
VRRLIRRVAQLFRPQGFVDDVLGHRMYQDPRDLGMDISRLSYATEENFPFGEIAAIRKFVHPGQVVLDLGANIGWFTLLFARHVGPAGRVIAFEPGQLASALLAANVMINGYGDRVTIERKAVGEAEGVLNIYVCPTGESDNRVGAALEFPNEQRKAMPIEVVRLDDYLRRHNIDSVDYIKLDIQGSEAAALRGLAATLRANSEVKVHMEFSCGWVEQSGNSPEDLLHMLQSLGFVFHDLREGEVMRRVTPTELLDRYRTVATNILMMRV